MNDTVTNQIANDYVYTAATMGLIQGHVNTMLVVTTF